MLTMSYHDGYIEIHATCDEDAEILHEVTRPWSRKQLVINNGVPSGSKSNCSLILPMLSYVLEPQTRTMYLKREKFTASPPLLL